MTQDMEPPMRNMAAKSTDHRSSGPDLRPMLTAMMVYLVGFGVAALIVGLAMWRQTSCSPNPQRSQQLYMVSSRLSFGRLAKKNRDVARLLVRRQERDDDLARAAAFATKSVFDLCQWIVVTELLAQGVEREPGSVFTFTAVRAIEV